MTSGVGGCSSPQNVWLRRAAFKVPLVDRLAIGRTSHAQRDRQRLVFAMGDELDRMMRPAPLFDPGCDQVSRKRSCGPPPRNLSD